ncbi:esterase-like activity of phytase family protein [Iningainema tapete]|uniref:Esterase-like activity of phytase family protein n=1 Tax=Iningainema tapete BLCC-T55 TaxID=2748662 RepID=A0A8J6XKR9_9CYAN|nr:esterase-like activity of phytase family protein [Iningainema tapete]MBD2778700.1 esterase-like activity of phytase family protein [Iningainema tapete BLCC-T55]
MRLHRKFLKLPKIFYFCVSILIIIFVGFLFNNLTSTAAEITGIDFIGQAIIPNNTKFARTPVGGLSGITYDAKNQVFYAISDDRSEKAPARFYTLKIDLSKSKFQDSDVAIAKVTTLKNTVGQPFSSGSLDPEGIALTSKETVFISSEGDASKLISPFIKEFSLSSGRELTTLPVPKKFLPEQNGKSGIRNNLAFESLTITPDEKNLFTATENALIQDGLEMKPNTSSFCRVLQYNLLTQLPEKEFLYVTEPVKPTFSFGQKFASGLPDLLALDNRGHFLSIERTFTGLGFYIRLYQISVDNSDDIQNIDSLLAIDVTKIKPVEKKLLLDLTTLDVALDNIEGFTLGPSLAGGDRSLILVSDNNFNSLQRTQILAFRLKMETPLMRLLRRLYPFK